MSGCNKLSDSVCLSFHTQIRATCVCLRLKYSCNCKIDSSLKHSTLVQFKSSPWSGTRLYINDLMEKVINLQGFISLEEINLPRPLRSTIYSLTRNSCISFS